MRRALTLAALGLAALVVAAPVAGAAGPRSFSPTLSLNAMRWSVAGIPDLDQLRPEVNLLARPGLPNGGRMYCGPTASADLLAYLSAMGFRTGVDGAVDYAAPGTGYLASLPAIRQLGEEMGTSPTAGSYVRPLQTTLERRLGTSGILRTVHVNSVTFFHGDLTDVPTPEEYASVGASGSLMLGMFGWYRSVGSGSSAYLIRTGGHFVALSGITTIAPYTAGTLAYRNPWSDGVLDAEQSVYTDDTRAVAMQPTRLNRVSTSTVETWDMLAMTDRANGFVEGYIALSPERYWTTFGSTITRLTPRPFHPEDPTVLTIPLGGRARDIALWPRTGQPLVLLGNGAVRLIGAGPGGKAGRAPDRTLATIRGAQAIAASPGGDLFAATLGTLVRVSRGQRATAKLPQPVQDLVVAPNGEVVALGADGRNVLRFSQDLRLLGSRTLKDRATALDVGADGAVVGTTGGLRDDHGGLVALEDGVLRVTRKGKAETPLKGRVAGRLALVDRGVSIFNPKDFPGPIDTAVDEPLPEPTPPPPPPVAPQG